MDEEDCVGTDETVLLPKVGVIVDTGTDKSCDCKDEVVNREGAVVTREGKGVVVTSEGKGVVVTSEGEGVVVTSEGKGAVVTREGKGVVVTREGEGVVVTREGEGIVVDDDVLRDINGSDLTISGKKS